LAHRFSGGGAESRRDRSKQSSGGSAFFASWRVRQDTHVEYMYTLLRGEVFRTGKNVASDAVHHLAEQGSALALIVVRFTERRLTRFVNMVKGRREVKNGNGTRSSYLRDVTNHRDEVRRINNYHPK